MASDFIINATLGLFTPLSAVGLLADELVELLELFELLELLELFVQPDIPIQKQAKSSGKAFLIIRDTINSLLSRVSQFQPALASLAELRCESQPTPRLRWRTELRRVSRLFRPSELPALPRRHLRLL